MAKLQFRNSVPAGLTKSVAVVLACRRLSFDDNALAETCWSSAGSPKPSSFQIFQTTATVWALSC